MRNGARLVLVTAVTLAAGAAAPRLRDALVELDLFRVRHVELEGARYLDRVDALAAAAVPADASVWDDPTAWETRLEQHPLVKDARVRRRPPATVVLEVDEREPVALAATPTLEPVDREGRLLPIDPARHRLDLPVVRGARPLAGPQRPGPARRWAPAGVRRLAAEVARLAEQEPTFVREVAVLASHERDGMEARWGEEDLRLLFRAPLTPLRLREARAALTDAGQRFPDRAVEAVDVRFADQVVVRFAGGDR